MIGSNMKISSILSRRNRILLRELVVTDFKLRYQGSVLGYIWSLLKPLLLFAILYIVFVHFLKIGSSIEHYPVYLLLGVVMWTFFIEATKQGMEAIVSRGELIRKINFPKYIIVVSGTLSALINFILNLFVVFLFVLLNGVDLKWSGLLLPISILELYIFSLAIAFLLAAMYVKYRDISHIWEVIIQGAFYATPILYPINLVAEQGGPFAAKILLIANPVAQIVQDARYSLVTHQSLTVWNFVDKLWVQLIPIFIVIITVVLAVWYFKKHQKYFAENI